MLPEVTNSKPPIGFAACTSESCLLREKCLRALLADELFPKAETMTVINARHSDYREGNECRFFRPVQTKRFAKGFTRAMKTLTRDNYNALTRKMVAMSSKTRFYRQKRGDTLLSPDEQAEVLALLRAYGYKGDAPFDVYEELLVWA